MTYTIVSLLVHIETANNTWPIISCDKSIVDLTTKHFDVGLEAN